MSKLAQSLCVLTLLLAIPGLAQTHKKGLAGNTQGYGTAGCGLGSILFGEQPGAIQILSSTTNYFYSNNTFGMTSGTSNCAPEAESGSVTAIFIEGNRQALENDMARGKGETLSTFAGLMGCKSSHAVGRNLQKNYRTILPKSDVSNQELLKNIESSLRTDKDVAHSCPQLG